MQADLILVYRLQIVVKYCYDIKNDQCIKHTARGEEKNMICVIINCQLLFRHQHLIYVTPRVEYYTA